MPRATALNKTAKNRTFSINKSLYLGTDRKYTYTVSQKPDRYD